MNLSEDLFETKMLKCIAVGMNNYRGVTQWLDRNSNKTTLKVGKLQQTDIKSLVGKWYFVQYKNKNGVCFINEVVPVPNELIIYEKL